MKYIHTVRAVTQEWLESAWITRSTHGLVYAYLELQKNCYNFFSCERIFADFGYVLQNSLISNWCYSRLSTNFFPFWNLLGNLGVVSVNPALKARPPARPSPRRPVSPQQAGSWNTPHLLGKRKRGSKGRHKGFNFAYYWDDMCSKELLGLEQNCVSSRTLGSSAIDFR